MRACDVNLIRHLPLFLEISPDQLPGLMETALIQNVPPNTQLFFQGDRPDFLHVLIEGQVELFAISADGRESVIEVLSPVDNFLLAAVLLDTPYLMGARVLESARILMLPAKCLRQEISRCPKLAIAMLASMAGQFRTMVKQLKDIKLRSGTQRLAAYLLRLNRIKGDRIILPISKKILAGRLNMSPENLSRAFATLRDYGVSVQGHSVTFSDILKLEEYGLPDALIDDVEPR
ncbi:MAG: cyclic nucleotide-binding domain-containing protein [Rhodospirillaceae bacterium]